MIAAQEEERRRIARELHDDTCQSLAALAISLDEVAEEPAIAGCSGSFGPGAIEAQVRSTLTEVRTLALNLRPSMLDDLGLTMAIDWYAKEQVATRGLAVDLDLNVAARGVASCYRDGPVQDNPGGSEQRRQTLRSDIGRGPASLRGVAGGPRRSRTTASASMWSVR